MKRVMICEDDLLLAMDLAHEVAEAGSQVVGTFLRSSEAWQAASVLEPDIAIVDINLADGSSGLPLATHLVEMGCKVIVVSGSTGVHPELGRIPHAFIAKPVPPGIIGELTAPAESTRCGTGKAQSRASTAVGRRPAPCESQVRDQSSSFSTLAAWPGTMCTR